MHDHITRLLVQVRAGLLNFMGRRIVGVTRRLGLLRTVNVVPEIFHIDQLVVLTCRLTYSTVGQFTFSVQNLCPFSHHFLLLIVAFPTERDVHIGSSDHLLDVIRSSSEGVVGIIVANLAN